MGITLGQVIDSAIESLKNAGWEGEDSERGIIALVCGEVGQGKSFWAYLDMPPSKYLAFMVTKESGGSYNLGEYGRVLRKGWGDLPPVETQREMEEAYALDHGKMLQDVVDQHIVPALEAALNG